MQLFLDVRNEMEAEIQYTLAVVNAELVLARGDSRILGTSGSGYFHQVDQIYANARLRFGRSTCDILRKAVNTTAVQLTLSHREKLGAFVSPYLNCSFSGITPVSNAFVRSRRKYCRA